MDIDSCHERLKSLMSSTRYAHVCRVADTAKSLASAHGLATEKAFLAGLLHDAAKQQTPDSAKALGVVFSKDEDALYQTYPKVWHAIVAPTFCRTVFDVEDNDVLSAMQWHTTGKDNMLALEQVVFIADYIEPGRPYADCDYIRMLAFDDLDKGTFALTASTLQSLKARGLDIHPLSQSCYDYYLQKLGEDVSRRILTEISVLSR